LTEIANSGDANIVSGIGR